MTALLFLSGLKQAVETVNDYNPLMKDFPLNDLLSATELDKIRQALVAIFTHLRKIRNTKYPIQRALRLVEAISRDLSSQLLKVLGTRKLMHVAYEEFEKVLAPRLENNTQNQTRSQIRVSEVLFASCAGDGGVFRGLPDVGGRVREAAGAPEGHREEEEGGEPEDGVASQSGAQEAPVPLGPHETLQTTARAAESRHRPSAPTSGVTPTASDPSVVDQSEINDS